MVKYHGENTKRSKNVKKAAHRSTHHHEHEGVEHLSSEVSFKRHIHDDPKVVTHQTIRTPRGKG